MPQSYRVGLLLLSITLVQVCSAQDSLQPPAFPEVAVPAPGEIQTSLLDLHQVTAAPASEDDASDLAARLSKIESAWDKFQADEKSAKEKAASKPTFQINGRIHSDYWAFPHASQGIGFFEHPDATDPQFGTDPEDFFAFRRVRLEMKGDILETGFWRIQVDFADPSEPTIKDVYLGFKELPGNQTLIIGNQKRPLGLDHLNSSRYNVFLERPFAVEAFNEDARRPGILFAGNNEDESLGWAYGAFLLKNITNDGSYRGDDYQGSLNARLFGSPWYDDSSGGRGYWHWGLAGMFAHPDGNRTNQASDDNEARFRTRPEGRTESRWLDTGRIPGAHYFETIGLESMLNMGSVQVTSEYQFNWTQRHSGFPQPDLFFHGGYIFAAWNITGEHIPYERESGTIGRLMPFENFFIVDRCRGGLGTGWGAWQVAARFDYLDLTDGDRTGGVGRAGTLALNWFFTPYTKLQFNMIYGNIDDRGPIGGFDSGDYLITGTRLAMEF